jgi:hypothetical protein
MRGSRVGRYWSYSVRPATGPMKPGRSTGSPRHCWGEGQAGPARTGHATALALARRAGDKDQQARACYGLGRVCLTAGNSARARRHWERALSLYTQLSAPESDQVRASMHDLDQPAGAFLVEGRARRPMHRLAENAS